MGPVSATSLPSEASLTKSSGIGLALISMTTLFFLDGSDVGITLIVLGTSAYTPRKLSMQTLYMLWYS